MILQVPAIFKSVQKLSFLPFICTDLKLTNQITETSHDVALHLSTHVSTQRREV